MTSSGGVLKFDNALLVKLLTTAGVLLFGGFTWWMTTVWANQESQAKEISGMQSELAALKVQVGNVDSKVTSVQTGVDTLVKLALDKTKGK